MYSPPKTGAWSSHLWRCMRILTLGHNTFIAIHYAYIYMYTHIHTYIHIYIYMYTY